ncbi:MAG: hypothetical protein Q4B40_06300 [Clostridia bacterium]|nr:hypothetical protein [Clostridia bacterium]
MKKLLSVILSLILMLGVCSFATGAESAPANQAAIEITTAAALKSVTDNKQ